MKCQCKVFVIHYLIISYFKSDFTCLCNHQGVAGQLDCLCKSCQQQTEKVLLTLRTPHLWMLRLFVTSMCNLLIYVINKLEVCTMPELLGCQILVKWPLVTTYFQTTHSISQVIRRIFCFIAIMFRKDNKHLTRTQQKFNQVLSSTHCVIEQALGNQKEYLNEQCTSI